MSNTVPRPLPIDPDGTFDSRYWLRNDPLAMGPQGPQGPMGPQGPKGDRGDEGQAVRIRWTVSSALDLPASNVNIGDGALVGTAGSYVLYVYANNPPAWVNAGSVSAGPQGPQGPQGPAGPQPPLAGSGSASTAARSDHDHAGVYSAVTHIHDAAAVTTGMFHPDRIPGLNAVKITAGTIDLLRLPDIPVSKLSGVLSSSQIPALDASKVTTGVLAAAQVPSLSADKINTGTLAEARIPTLPTTKITSGVFSEALIPNLSANKVTNGTFSVDRIPKMTLAQLFPNNVTSKSGTSAMRVGPGNSHAVLTTLGNGWGLHDTGMRQNTDEMWAYVMVPGLGFGWIPANRI